MKWSTISKLASTPASTPADGDHHHLDSISNRRLSANAATTTTTTMTADDNNSCYSTTYHHHHHQHSHNTHVSHINTTPSMSAIWCLAISLFLVAAVLNPPTTQAFPTRNRRYFFTTCWGWGASCSLYGRSDSVVPASSAAGGSSRAAASSAPTRSSVEVVRQPVRTAPLRGADPFEIGVRTSGRLPSPFSSINWGAGTMGKRRGPPFNIVRRTAVSPMIRRLREAVRVQTVTKPRKQQAS